MKGFFEAKGVSAGYFAKEVVTDINMSVARGEFVGIIGPNGAGKSTFIRALSRTLKPQAGSVEYQGKDIYGMPSNEAARLISVVPQDTFIVFEFTVMDIVMMGRIPYINKFGKETKVDFAAAERSMELTRTKELAGRLISELSAGERQRVIIAKALAQDPGLLIMDEPTSHLDISHQIEIFDLIKGLAKKDGLAVISVLHDLNLASEYCDRLILMNEGRVHSQGAPDEVLNYKTIEEVYRTVVVVEKNPVSGKPHCFLVPKNRRNAGESPG